MKLDLAGFEPAPTAMVANLPYSVATPLILRTIELLPSLRRWTVMVQREIADRLRAAPGSRTYGSPSVVAQLACEVELVRKVDPAVFKPRPRVDSAILRLRRTGPGADQATRRAHPRRLRPPPQVPRPLARARRQGLAGAGAGGARRARAGRGRARRGALARSSSPPFPRSCRKTPDPAAAAMLLHAPAKLNLCLYLGQRRGDGLHELCSLFEPLALADLIDGLRGGERRGDLPRGRGGEPGRPGAGGAARARLGAAAAAGRDREAGAGGGRARRRQRRRRGGPPPRRRRGRRPAGAGRRARRRRAFAAAARAGPGRGRRRAGRAAARAGCPTPRCCCPTAAASAPPRSSPRPTGSASAASPTELEALAVRLRERPAPAPRRSPTPSCSSTTSSSGALAAPGDRRRARRAARSRRPGRSAQRLRPDRGRALPRSRRRPRRGRGDRPRRRDRLRGGEGAMRMPGEGGEGGNRKHLLIAIAVAIVGARLLLRQPRARQPRPAGPAGRHLQHARRLDLPAGRLLRLRRDRRLRRPRRPRRDDDAARRRRRRPGRDRHLPADRDRLVRRPGLGDTTSFFLGRRLGREFVLRHGPRVGISHERFEKVEDYFSRHGGKTIFIGRLISLVRAFAPFIAGSSGMRYRAFVPYSILGTGLWASAHILIGYFFSRSVETGAEYAGKGRLPARHPDRRRRRLDLPLPPLPGRREPRRRGALDGGPRRSRAGWSRSGAATGRSSGSSGTGSPPAAPSGSSSPR